MAKTKKEETAVVSSDLSKSLEIISASKAEIDKIGSECLLIKVMDESTLSVAQNNLSKANDMVKFIEEKRVEIKAPYLEASKTIDSTCKELAESVIKAVEHLKLEIKNYELKRVEDARKAKEELERKQREEQEKIEAEKKRKEEVQKYLQTLSDFCKKQYNSLKTIDDCDKLTKTLNDKWPDNDKVKGFESYSIE